MSTAEPPDAQVAALLTVAADQGPAGIFVADEQMRFLAVNTTAAEILGHSRSRLLELGPAGVVAGVAGPLFERMKQSDSQHGLRALRHAEGHTVIVEYRIAPLPGRPQLYAAFFMPRRRLADGAAPKRGSRSALSTREREIVELLADGFDTEEIGHALHLAPDTVKSHISRILQKLRARNRTHAVALALRKGVIDASFDDAQPR